MAGACSYCVHFSSGDWAQGLSSYSDISSASCHAGITSVHHQAWPTLFKLILTSFSYNSPSKCVPPKCLPNVFPQLHILPQNSWFLEFSLPRVLPLERLTPTFHPSTHPSVHPSTHPSMHLAIFPSTLPLFQQLEYSRLCIQRWDSYL